MVSTTRGLNYRRSQQDLSTTGGLNYRRFQLQEVSTTGGLKYRRSQQVELTGTQDSTQEYSKQEQRNIGTQDRNIGNRNTRYRDLEI